MSIRFFVFLLCITSFPTLCAKAQESPATVATAAKTIDLTKFELVGEQPKAFHQVVASQSYETGGSVEAVFQKIAQKLNSDGWKELDGKYVKPAMASGSYSKNQFVVTISVMPGGNAGRVQVTITNAGNVDWKKLPLPNTWKQVYAFPSSAMFQTDLDAEKTKQELALLLEKEGWSSFGEVVGSYYFRKNAVKLMAMIGAAPGLNGKTSVQFTAEQLSCVLPIPKPYSMLQYTDQQGRMTVDIESTPSQAWAFYKGALAKDGWKATTENPIKIRNEDHLIFRDEKKDSMEVAVFEFEGKTRIEVEYQTAGQVEAMNTLVEKMVAEALEKRKKSQAASAAKEATELAIALPAGLNVSKRDSKNCEATVPSGTAAATVQGIVKSMESSGWKAKARLSKGIVGDIELVKDGFEIDINYVDPGFVPGQIDIQVFGAGQLKIVP
jgi:hypothetical protein